MKTLRILILLMLLALLLNWQDGIRSRGQGGPRDDCPCAPVGGVPATPDEKIGRVSYDETLRRGPFVLRSSTPARTVIHFELPDYTIEKECRFSDGRSYNAISCTGALNGNRRGCPSLPLFRCDIALSGRCRSTVRLENARYDRIESCRPVWGDGPMLRRDAAPPAATPRLDIYDGQNPYPSQMAAALPQYSLRSCIGQGVLLTPFQFVPSTQSLRVLRSADIVIESDAAEDSGLYFDDNADMAAAQQRQFLNAGCMKRRSDSGDFSIGKLLIVIPEEWQDNDALKQFISWKESIGWTVRCCLFGETSGITTADELKTHLRHLYRTGEYPLTHIVVAGDYLRVPPSQHGALYYSCLNTQCTNLACGRIPCTAENCQCGECIDAAECPCRHSSYALSASALNSMGDDGYRDIMHWYVPSDIGYALLEDDGDLDVRDAFISRLPVRSVAQFEQILSKLMQLERGPSDSDWLSRALFMGSNEKNNVPPYAGRRDREHLEYQRSALYSLYAAEETTTLYADGKKSISSTDVQEALTAGVGFMEYLGHGQCNYLTTSKFSSGDIRELSGSAMPWVILPVCYAGNLDHTAENSYADDVNRQGQHTKQEESIAAVFFQSAHAAVVMAATDQTFWEPPMVFLDAFTQRQREYYDKEHLLFSGAYFNAACDDTVAFCQNYTQEYPQENSRYLHGDGTFFTWEMAMYGDCSALPRMAPLRKMRCRSELSEDRSIIRCCVELADAEENFSPRYQAVVCIEDADGGYAAALTDEDGCAELPRRTEQYTIRVIDCAAAMIEFSAESTVDADGDGVVSNSEILSWLTEFYQRSGSDSELERALALWRERPDGTAEQPAAATMTTRAAAYESSSELFRRQFVDVHWKKMDADLTPLAQQGLSLVCTNCPAEGWARFQVNQSEKEWLSASGYEFTAASSTEKTRSEEKQRYRSCDEIGSLCEELSMAHWPDIRSFSIGESLQGRPVTALRIAVGEENDDPASVRPQLLLCGGIHGDEKPAVEMLLRLIEKIAAGDQQWRQALSRVELYVIPLCNPDGYDADTRENSAGYDLNRGFPDGAIETDGVGKFGRGDRMKLDEPHSFGSCSAYLQPEQVSLMRFCAAHQFTEALHFHTGSLLVCYPFGNNPQRLQSYSASPDDDAFITRANDYARCHGSMEASPSYVMNASEMYPVDGEFSDWQYRYLGTLPLTIEANHGVKEELSVQRMAEICTENEAAILSWMTNAADSHRHGVVRNTAGEAVPWTAVSAEDNDASISYADCVGRYSRSANVDAGLCFSKEGYLPASEPQLTADDSVPALAVSIADNRFVPGEKSTMGLCGIGKGIPAAVLQVKSPSGWTAEYSGGWKERRSNGAVDEFLFCRADSDGDICHPRLSCTLTTAALGEQEEARVQCAIVTDGYTASSALQLLPDYLWSSSMNWKAGLQLLPAQIALGAGVPAWSYTAEGFASLSADDGAYTGSFATMSADGENAVRRRVDGRAEKKTLPAGWNMVWFTHPLRVSALPKTLVVYALTETQTMTRMTPSEKLLSEVVYWIYAPQACTVGIVP